MSHQNWTFSKKFLIKFVLEPGANMVPTMPEEILFKDSMFQIISEELFYIYFYSEELFHIWYLKSLATLYLQNWQYIWGK